jgi:hypothetical protein
MTISISTDPLTNRKNKMWQDSIPQIVRWCTRRARCSCKAAPRTIPSRRYCATRRSRSLIVAPRLRSTRVYGAGLWGTVTLEAGADDVERVEGRDGSEPGGRSSRGILPRPRLRWRRRGPRRHLRREVVAPLASGVAAAVRLWRNSMPSDCGVRGQRAKRLHFFFLLVTLGFLDAPDWRIPVGKTCNFFILILSIFFINRL